VTGVSNDRILVAAPLGRDAELICTQLSSAGMDAVKVADAVSLANEIAAGAGAIIVTEEVLSPDGLAALSRALAKQPAWSEIPLIVLAAETSLSAKSRTTEGLGDRTNVTIIDRPVRIKSLVSAAQSALRARRRQYEVRGLMTQLENRLHERDKFLAILGHELRNPLSAILLASQMADDEGRLDREHVQLIERQSRHLTQLVNDLLDLSRVVTGKIVLKPRLIDLRDVAQQSLRMIEAAAAEQGVEISYDLPAEALRIYADPVRIEQILNNLLTNAVKYTPRGGHVHVSVQSEMGNAVICVQDDGVGIAPERIDGIFEMFAQLDNAIGRSQGGMGIGLSLVRNLVQLHGGSVRAKSDGIGKGCEFIVTLPLAAADVAEQSRRPISHPQVKRDGESRRIVIVEDNKDVRDLLMVKLRRLGHEVIGAGDGVEGLKRITEAKPDVALVDLGLPGIDGFEVASKTRQELGDQVVLVAVSGFGRPEDVRRALEAGFDEHLTKPADVQDIESLLQRIAGE